MRAYYTKIYKKTKKEFLYGLEQDIQNEKKLCVVTANPEILMLAERMSKVRNLLMAEDTLIVPDGIGILMGGKKLGYSFSERIPGVEICSDLFVYADKNKKSLFLFGAKPEVVQILAEKIEKEYPGIELLGYEDGYIKDKDAVFEKMKVLRPDIILVALGAPLQEMLIQKHIGSFEKGVFIGVGGSFDVLSGCKKRAPKFFVKLNLEWLYRIATEPKRLKRFWNNNVKFLFVVGKEKR